MDINSKHYAHAMLKSKATGKYEHLEKCNMNKWERSTMYYLSSKCP